MRKARREGREAVKSRRGRGRSGEVGRGKKGDSSSFDLVEIVSSMACRADSSYNRWRGELTAEREACCEFVSIRGTLESDGLRNRPTCLECCYQSTR